MTADTDKTAQERERFEARLKRERPRASVEREKSGHYAVWAIEMAWFAWQARAALDAGATMSKDNIANIIREHVRVDATGLAPAVIGHYICGIEEAAEAILAAPVSSAAPKPLVSDDLAEQARKIIATGCGCDESCRVDGDGCGCRSDAEAILALCRASIGGNDTQAVSCIACEGHPQAPNDPCSVCGKASTAAGLTVDALAQAIRSVDGRHQLGAGALAVALMPYINAAPAHPDDFERGAEAMQLLAATEVIALGGVTRLAEAIMSLPLPKKEG